jgi:hypothetical protein
MLGARRCEPATVGEKIGEDGKCELLGVTTALAGVEERCV